MAQTNKANKLDMNILNTITKKAHAFATAMIYFANHREHQDKTDPKVGGHPTASASSLHILGSLHLVVKSGFDHQAIKPHTSPTDHAFNYLLNLFLDAEKNRLNDDLSQQAMYGLRAFCQQGEPVFQSYHSKYDPDHEGYLPSGTVGIPPVNLGYLALAYKYAENQGFKVPQPAHFWALIGDSEFREGSLFEAMPDFAERQIGHLTWIIDYNRQSLDGQRIVNSQAVGHDCHRIAQTAIANGWEVITVQHGSFRKKLFQKNGGEVFQNILENKLEDLYFQALLLNKDALLARQALLKIDPQINHFLKEITDKDLLKALQDLGGHDYQQLIPALEKSKTFHNKPSLIIAHTIKGWGLQSAAQSSNHNALPSKQEITSLLEAQGLSLKKPFEKFPVNSLEGKFLKKRGDELLKQFQEKWSIKKHNQQNFQKKLSRVPHTLDINLKLAPYSHTQWMLGQLVAKLIRVAQTPRCDLEKAFQPLAQMMTLMSPDVGTSTNLQFTMDEKVFGQIKTTDYETQLNVRDKKAPILIPNSTNKNQFLRFEIAEASSMSCMGSFGKIKEILGIPLIPLMTIYDFFIKRALDQYFYNLYWDSSFILFGTPSGVTLSSEGAQHGWKSDFQIPHQITWEPCFCQELDWIFVDSLKKHFSGENHTPQRTGVLIRCFTRGVYQKEFLTRLKTQQRFKASKPQVPLHPSSLSTKGAIDESSVETLSENDILKYVREDVLKGGYYLIDYRGYVGYEPGDNVVHIFTMGSVTTEAIVASDVLLKKGIYANVIIVTSPDLLVGHLGFADGYTHLKKNLNITAELHLKSKQLTKTDLITLAGGQIPLVSVHDGEPGLLDNIGSIVGVKHKSLAVRKHSKCGCPRDIYKYHGIDKDAIVVAVDEVLSDLALTDLNMVSS